MIPALLPWLLVAAVSAASGAGIAWRMASDQGAARLAQCEQARERDARAAAETASRLHKKAEAGETRAAARLAAAEAASRKKIEETRREIYSLADGRECLSGALRLRLNATLAAADGLPENSGGADTAAAATADDAAVALWVVDAASLYEQCRARIDAIREWDEVTHGR